MQIKGTDLKTSIPACPTCLRTLPVPQTPRVLGPKALEKAQEEGMKLSRQLEGPAYVTSRHLKTAVMFHGQLQELPG